MTKAVICFNTQPPEGGWTFPACSSEYVGRFNTQPPEGGWAFMPPFFSDLSRFQHTAA